MKRVILITLLLGGCTTFEAPSIVIDLRVLGMRAEPAEVVVDFDIERPEDTVFPTVTIKALVADPADDRRLEWGMTVCPPTESLRCDDPFAPFLTFASGTLDDPEAAGPDEPAPIEGSFDITPIILEASVRADNLLGFGGIGVQIELWVRPEGAPLADAVWAAKRVIFAPRVPAERVANTNPSLDELMADGVPFTSARCGADGVTPLAVAPGQEVVLDPIEPEGVRETYVLPQYDGGVTTITENLRYSWFATGGELESEMTGGPIDPFGNDPPLDTTWIAPDEPGRVNLWLVQRDERGGATWTQRCFEVAP